MTESQVITRLFGEVVAATETAILAELQETAAAMTPAQEITGIEYNYGHMLELATTLQQINNSPKVTTKKLANNPMVWLLEDFTITKGATNYYGSGSFRILICKVTDAALTSSEREDYNYIPFLNPIYDELMNQLAASPYFVSNDIINHTVTDRKFLGRQSLYNNEGNLTNDFLDSKDIIIQRLIINDINCLTPININ